MRTARRQVEVHHHEFASEIERQDRREAAGDARHHAIDGPGVRAE
jgi:hypothetical protein